MSPKPAKQKPKKVETTEVTSDSESMEEMARVTYGSEDSSPFCGDKTGGLHADTSGVIQAINSMKVDMASQFETVLSAVQDIKNQFAECFGRLTQTEERISQTEVSVSTLQSTTNAHEKKITALAWKIDDLENRSRRSNLRLLGLPEKSEGNDACTFLENWLPEALDMEPLRKPLAIERAHRIGYMRKTAADTKSIPRVMIVKFLDYRDKKRVMRAARAKKDVLFQNHRIMFFPDLSAEVNKQRRQFDEVKKKLRAKGLMYGFIFPARLRVTVDGHTHVFQSPSEVNDFLMSM